MALRIIFRSPYDVSPALSGGASMAVSASAAVTASTVLGDPSANPNGLPLIGSATLASAEDTPSFERLGVTYPDDFARLVLDDGDVNGGYIHMSLGKTPSSYIGQNATGGSNQVYTTLEVALHVRLQGEVPYKLFRAHVFVDSLFSEAAVGHVWFSQPEAVNLVSDPVRGVVGETVQTLGYNDFGNFIWEGQFSGTAAIVDGEWHLVRMQFILNDPGQANGVCRVWIDDVLDIEDTTINFIDDWGTPFGWNAFYLEAYDNDGSNGGCVLDFRNIYFRGIAKDTSAVSAAVSMAVTANAVVSNVTPVVGDAPDWVLDWSDYADINEVLALSNGFADRTNGAGAIALSTVTGQLFTKAFRATYYTPSSVDQEVGMTVDFDWDGWASTAQPREIWLHMKVRHSLNFSYSGPSPGGGPGGKYIFFFDQQQLSAPVGSRFNMSLGINDGTEILMIHNGNGGGYDLNNRTQIPLSQLADGQWMDCWLHVKMDDASGIFETYLDGLYSAMDPGVDTSYGSQLYLTFMALGGNINTGTASNGMWREYGPINIWLNEPTGWPGATPMPDDEVNFAQFTSTSEMLADPRLEAVTSVGASVILDTIQGYACARCTHPSGSAETTAGLVYYIPNASTDQSREGWWSVDVLFQPGWNTTGPYSGNADHKFLFAFDQVPDGSRRWESHIGHFGTGVGHFVAGNGTTRGNATALWDGEWHTVRYHLKYGTAETAIWIVDIPDLGYTYAWEPQGGFDATFAGYYLNSLNLGANVNRGFSTPRYLAWKDVKFWKEGNDPGWGF